MILYGFGFKNVQINNTAPRLGDVKRNFSNTSKAKNLLGWNAKVQLQQGLKRTVDWFIGMGTGLVKNTKYREIGLNDK